MISNTSVQHTAANPAVAAAIATPFESNADSTDISTVINDFIHEQDKLSGSGDGINTQPDAVANAAPPDSDNTTVPDSVAPSPADDTPASGTENLPAVYVPDFKLSATFAEATTVSEIQACAAQACVGKTPTELAKLAAKAWSQAGGKIRTLTEAANRNRLIAGTLLNTIKQMLEHGQFEEYCAPLLEKLGCRKTTRWKLMTYAAIPNIDRYLSVSFEKVFAVYRRFGGHFPDSNDPLAEIMKTVGVTSLDDIDMLSCDIDTKIKALRVHTDYAKAGMTLEEAERLVRAGHADDVKKLHRSLKEHTQHAGNIHDAVSRVLAMQVPTTTGTASKKPVRKKNTFPAKLSRFLDDLEEENDRDTPTLVDRKSERELRDGVILFLKRRGHGDDALTVVTAGAQDNAPQHGQASVATDATAG